MSTRNIFWS